MDSYVTKIFGQEITLKKGAHLPTGQIAISATSTAGEAWSRLYLYDPADQIIEPDSAKLNELLELYRKRGTKGLGFVIFILDAVVKVAEVLWRIVAAIAGSFVGFGLLGFVIVIALLLAVLALGTFGLIYLSPVIALSFFLKFLRNKKLKDGANSLTQEALDFAMSVASPLLVDGHEVINAPHEIRAVESHSTSVSEAGGDDMEARIRAELEAENKAKIKADMEARIRAELKAEALETQSENA